MKKQTQNLAQAHKLAHNCDCECMISEPIRYFRYNKKITIKIKHTKYHKPFKLDIYKNRLNNYKGSNLQIF